MTGYISHKTFFTRGIANNKEIITGVIPGLNFNVKGSNENGLVYLENIDTGSIIIVTRNMLNSKLFIRK